MVTRGNNLVGGNEYKKNLKFFGTDGIRGNAINYLNSELVRKIGFWSSQVLPKKGPILIGQDSRSSSDRISSALTIGLNSSGREVWLLGLCPTPAIPYLIRKYKASGGLMISASHNPPEDNGIKIFDCNGIYMEIYDHPNYDFSKSFLEKNLFINKFKIREYSLDLSTLDLSKYDDLIYKLENKGIKFYDSKLELSNQPNHYKKLEELEWIISQDFPMPEGLYPERSTFKEFMKQQKLFEEKRYGIDMIAVYNDRYIGSTDIEVYPKSDPEKGWTGGLGVIKEFRRQGIATALKVKAYEKLKEKGIKIVRTDNEENNPMYLINVALGFKPEPYGLEYQKEI